MPTGAAPPRYLAYLPTLPHLYVTPKIHKDPIKYRPIVSQARAFTTPLARHLSDILTPHLGTCSSAHLRDSVHLKTLLLEKADPNVPFVSIDVESLFTNVPTESLLSFLRTKHAEGNLSLPDDYTIDGFLDLIRLCITATIFTFNGKYYKQQQGIAMGSPLAPALACLYMEFWESELLNTIPGPKPIFWVRYIDDILLQWPHSYEDFNIFLRNLNLLEDLINVQAEWELIDPSRPNSATMPFLDLLIHRSPDGFKFNIYRKPTSTDLYTHYYSAHSLPTKRGVLISLFLRALRLCDESFLSSEIEHISSAFRKLKYPPWIIDKALSIATARFHNPTTRPPRRQTKHHLALPDHPSLQSLRPALSNIGIGTSFSTRNTLKKQLSRTGPKAPVDVPGVYSVECKVADCPNGTYFWRNWSESIQEDPRTWY